MVQHATQRMKELQTHATAETNLKIMLGSFAPAAGWWAHGGWGCGLAGALEDGAGNLTWGLMSRQEERAWGFLHSLILGGA